MTSVWSDLISLQHETTFFNIYWSSDLFMINYFFSFIWKCLFHLHFLKCIFSEYRILGWRVSCFFRPELDAQGLGQFNYHRFIDLKTEDAKTVNRSQKLWLQASCSLLIHSNIIFLLPLITLLLQRNELLPKKSLSFTFTGLGVSPHPRPLVK